MSNAMAGALPRKFPFKTAPQTKDVASALRLFKVLWDNHQLRGGNLSTQDMQHAFHSAISDTLSYADGGWKCGKYWSRNAWKMACDAKKTSGLGLMCEHVVPRGCVLAHAMEVLTSYEQAAQFAIENSFVCVVTTEENNRLNAAGYSKTHPAIGDPWLRYTTASPPIHVLNIPNFLNQEEQDALTRHGLLFAPTDEFHFAESALEGQ